MHSFTGSIMIQRLLALHNQQDALAGILTAHYLSEAGLHTVVLERDRIGSGQTGGTTAKITSQHGLIYRRIKERLRVETARIRLPDQ